jgi:hypothetical protein
MANSGTCSFDPRIVKRLLHFGFSSTRMAMSADTKSFTQESQNSPVLLRYLTFRIVLPTMSHPFPAHFLYSRLALLVLETIPSNFRVWIGLFISQEIELSAVVLHHLHGHYEPLQLSYCSDSHFIFQNLYVSLGILPYVE